VLTFTLFFSRREKKKREEEKKKKEPTFIGVGCVLRGEKEPRSSPLPKLGKTFAIVRRKGESLFQ